MPRLNRLTALSARQVQIGTAVFCLVLIVAVWLAAFLVTERDRVHTIEAEKLRNANLAIAFEAHSVRTLKNVALILTVAIRDFRREGNALKLDQFDTEIGIDPKLLQYIS